MSFAVHLSHELPVHQATKSMLTFADLRLVFTSDGVIVGVVIRSVEQYDLVEIKPTDGVGSRTPIPLMTPLLMIK